MIYGREGRKLLDFERAAAGKVAACVFATPAEVELFASLAPECTSKLHAIGNGVDTEYFAPRREFASPYSITEEPIVFTGVMDYWPNIDAVSWFAREVMPLVRRDQPRARFYVVGMNPASTVTALAADEAVVVTGKVADVRPYLQHARVAVAPLRVTRGVQNKALEAMAMARPVVVSAAVAQGIVAAPGVEFELASDAREFSQKVLKLMDEATGNAMGQRARRRIVTDYNWDSKLAVFADLLNAPALASRATHGS
jgi:sugar transferase (PEP-CTERM/EpsH1 system associated)